MSDSPQVGDTVRLTHTIEGDVFMVGPTLTVSGWALVGPNRTVEILSRATTPPPREPGTYWLDKDDDVWRANTKGVLESVANPGSVDPEDYAPFEQLVRKGQVK